MLRLDGEETVSSGERFFHNVLWSWSGVLFAIASGLFLSPFIIHRLGDARYGIWVLVYSMVEYYQLVDFGFKSAVLKYTAHYRATGEIDRLEEVVSTGFLYFSAAGVLIFLGSVALAWNATRFFPVAAEDIGAFRFLIIMTGLIEGLGTLGNTCTAVIEAHQRFDVSNRISLLGTAVRVFGSFAVVYLGYGLRALGAAVFCGQLLTYYQTYRALFRLFPGRKFSLRLARRATARHLFAYGRHTFLANISLMVLNQDAPILVGHFLSPTFAGYYGYPLRLLTYSVDLVSRIGMVTGSKAAELIARGDRQAILRMAVLVNRYSLMLFLPLAVYLSIFGAQLLRVWLNAAFAAYSAPIIPVLAAGIVIAIAAGYNSTSILYGLGTHSWLASSVFVEAIASLAGLFYVVPRYGLLGAAAVVSALMILSRGVFVPWAVSRQLGIGFGAYIGGIYRKPLLVATPVGVLVWYVNRAAGRPATWATVLGGGAAMAVCYYSLCFFFALEPQHRQMIVDLARSRLRFLHKAAGLSQTAG